MVVPEEKGVRKIYKQIQKIFNLHQCSLLPHHDLNQAISVPGRVGRLLSMYEGMLYVCRYGTYGMVPTIACSALRLDLPKEIQS